MNEERSDLTQIRLTPKAVEDGVLRVWLRRIPEEGGEVLAFREGQAHAGVEPLASAFLYGRGPGSTAQERAMLLFRLPREMVGTPLEVGELIELRLDPVADKDLVVHFDVVEVE